MKSALFFYCYLFLVVQVFSQTRTDTSRYYGWTEIKTYDEQERLRIKCQFDSIGGPLKREVLYDLSGKEIRNEFYDESGSRYLRIWNSSTGRTEYFSYVASGILISWGEEFLDGYESQIVEYDQAGRKYSDGFMANVEVFTAGYEDTVSLRDLEPLHYKAATPVGLWHYYYREGSDSAVGDYDYLCIMSVDTDSISFNGEYIWIGIVSESYGIKTGTWYYYSPEGKLLYTEEWNKGNLLLRETH